jgi:bisphosphoglycerate-independent phosphoglycerate mutase (AlkP superfamily)
MDVQAAAISLQNNNFVVVLVNMDMVTNSGEADMAIDALEPKFGQVPVILMAQREDTSPVYYGNQDLVEALRDVPIDEMPWKSYSV